MGNEVLTDGGGPVLQRVKVVLTFRGAGWANGAISSSEVRRSFVATLASPYMSQLIQYRGIRRAQIIFTQEDTADMGRLGPDPRKFVSGNIWLIADEDVRNAARVALRARPPQENEEVLYLVVVSQDPIPIVVEFQDASGYHSQFLEDGVVVRYGVLLHQSASTAEEAWHYLPGVFSHELVEACTDPDTTSGFHVVIDGKPEELCDLDDTRPVRLNGFAPEVKLAAYWSELGREAVVPTVYSLRAALGKRPTDPVPSVKTAIAGTDVRAFIRAGCDV